MNRSVLSLVFWPSACVLCLGCTAGSPFAARPQPPSSSAVATNPNSTAAATGSWEAAVPQNYAQPAAPAGSSIGTKMKQMGDKVSDSLTIKPKVIPANDPIKLSSQPKPVPAMLFVQAAWNAERQGNDAVAASQYAKALERDPRALVTLISYARFLDRTGKPEEALRIYHQAQTVDPRHAPLWNDLGLFHARRNELAAASQALNQAVLLQPGNLRYRNNLAAVLIESQRPEDAVREFEKVHSPAVARHNVGYLLYLQKRNELAADYFAAALRLDPTLASAQQMLAQLKPRDSELVGSAGQNAPQNNGGPSQPAVGEPFPTSPAHNRAAWPAKTTPDTQPAGPAQRVAERPRRVPVE